MRKLAGIGWLLLGLACVALPAAPADAARARVHVVAQGQSLWSIARQHRVTVKALRALNGLADDAEIRPGQRLRIPAPGAEAPAAPAMSKTQPAAASEAPRETRTRASGFVPEKPGPETQTQKTAEERGVNPCNTPDPGWGIYSRWDRSPSMGQMILPRSGGVTRDGRFDVVFHFHGHEPVRKEWVQVMDGAVLVGIDLGIGSGPYASAFSDPAAFERLVKSVEAAVAAKTGKKRAVARKIGLSAWSAGYGAVQEILGQAYGRKHVDAVVLLDGLHCGYSGAGLNGAQLAPFVEFARRAARRQAFMFVSHSSIIPPGYASTTETAAFLAHEVGGAVRRVRGAGPMGMDQITRYSRGSFHVRGYAGNDKMDHCAHIGLFRDVLKHHLKPRWKSPRGRG
ncbi:MAG: LysM peptidoglycan-binding domain-containing protein [Polyangiaceae bacterium]|nr:LysM peptidoglycan-binding domain-containing protein [Polyangiaceae bacterium]